jgi:hypothetical protein
MEEFFKPSVDAIIRDIQCRLESQAIDVCDVSLPFQTRARFEHVFRQFIILTGGFGESPYLKHALVTRLDPPVNVVIANSPK